MIEVRFTAETPEEYKRNLEILGATNLSKTVVSVDSPVVAKKVAETVKEKKQTSSGEDDHQTSTSEASADKIKSEVAKKTRYFKHEDTGKTFVIEKGKGLPVEAIEHGAATELTKAEYDKLKKKPAEKEEGVTDKADETDDEVTLTLADMRTLVKKGADLKLHKQMKATFADLDSSDGKLGGVDPSRYAELKEAIEGLIAEAE